ncbi:adaptor protein MecA [Lactobacillus psittaci]|uniref:adaptor protein MecA n=1 Tax=Lactobacillus psittaci TaxID=116089 RepID=UPI0004196968|nr:adaptor protein MecA [Lactobacillus psittaci]
MEVNRINENTLRIRLTTAELKERGIGMLDLLGNKSKIQDFLYSVLEEADTSREFVDSQPVAFQVIPNKNGLDLLVAKSKGGADLGDFLNNEVLSNLKDNNEAEAQVNPEVKSQCIFIFNDIDLIADLADMLPSNHQLGSTLYQFNNQFMLLVTDLAPETPDREAIRSQLWAIFLEYGCENNDIKPENLKFSGRCLIQQDALGKISYYFK